VTHHLRSLACALACGAGLGAPATAGAAVSITQAELTPSTTQAAAHPNVTIRTVFGGLGDSASGDDVKSVRAVLPQGLLGDPAAAGRCGAADFAADTCPADTKVGTTTVKTTAKVVLVDTPISADGDVYSLVPAGSEPARLGVVVRPLGGILGKIFLQAPVTLGPESGYGLATTFDDLPREASGLPIRLDEMSLTLNATAARGPFMTNPTSCSPATMQASAASYDAPGAPATATASFTPTGCASVPFAPRLEGSLGAAGETAKGRHPPLRTTVVLPPGGANLAKVSVMLPADLGADVNALGRGCPADRLGAPLTCPPESSIGRAVAASPLAPAPLTGPVILGSGAIPPPLVIPLTGAVPLTLRADATLPTNAGEGITNTIAGLPDLPVTRFDLSLTGGAGALLANGDDLCRRGAQTTARAVFTSHSGRTVNASVPLVLQGCAGASPAGAKPKATIALRFRKRIGSLTARFSAASGAAALKTARLTLPAGLSTRARAAAIAGPLRVFARGRRLGGSAVSVRGRTLTIRVPGTGGRAVSVRWTGLSATGSLARRLSSRPRLTFVARLLDAAKRTTTLRMRVRPSVAR
jgi:hypothetical protein